MQKKKKCSVIVGRREKKKKEKGRSRECVRQNLKKGKLGCGVFRQAPPDDKVTRWFYISASLPTPCILVYRHQ